MSITYAQALEVLSSGEPTVASLSDLVRSISGAVEGVRNRRQPVGLAPACRVGPLQQVVPSRLTG